MSQEGKNKQPVNPRSHNKQNKARIEKEQKQIKMLKIGGISVAVVIAIAILSGILYQFVYVPNKTLAKVNGQKINPAQYQEAVRYQRAGIISNYSYMKQLYTSFGMEIDEATRKQYESQLAPEYANLIGQQAINSLVDQKILDYGAKLEGISIDENEVSKQMESMFGYYPNGTATPKPTELPFDPTPTISDAQLAILKYTDTPQPTATAESLSEKDDETSLIEAENSTETPIAASEAEAEATSEIVEPEATPETVATAEPSAEPTITLTPTTYTEEMYATKQSSYFASNTYYSKEFLKGMVSHELLQEKVMEKLKTGIERNQDQVWARHILVATEEEANKVIERLKAGEDWGAIAAEVSTDTSNKDKGGDLGWFTAGTMVEAFDKAAFSQEVGSISQTPVQTDFGYHIIQVIGHEVRPLSSNSYDQLVQKAYSDWLESYRAQMDIHIDEAWKDYTPTDPELPRF